MIFLPLISPGAPHVPPMPQRFAGESAASWITRLNAHSAELEAIERRCDQTIKEIDLFFRFVGAAVLGVVVAIVINTTGLYPW